MTGVRALSGTAILVAAVLLWRSIWIVDEGDIALRTRLGQVVGAPCGPGLHLKSPLDETHVFDLRVVSRTYPGDVFVTLDQKPINVDFYIKWKVVDALRYFQATGGDEEVAAQRLTGDVHDRLRQAVAGQSLATINQRPRGTLSEASFEEMQRNAEGLGIDLVDVQLQHVELTDDVAAAVSQRMQQGLIAQATQLHSAGAADAEKIRADADRKRADILADATRQSQHLRGQADVDAVAVLARAYGRNTEFAAFYRSMQAYRKTLGREGDILIISPEGDFFKYLHSASAH
jgi:modulator of FtsH protease HflC